MLFKVFTRLREICINRDAEILDTYRKFM